MAVVREVVLTGGPCGGKTTAMTEVAARLRADGWRVLVVPEMATMFIEGGVADLTEFASDPVRIARFQRALISTQGALRSRYRDMADALGDERCAILYDRAECDSAAYVAPGWFAAVLDSIGLSVMSVRDSYDAVIHMTSAAVAAPGEYTTENNPARSESAAEAAALDAATLAAWVGHPRLTVVPNYDDFADKVDHCFSAVSAALGVPSPLEVERKFVLEAAPPPAELAAMAEVSIEQTYLRSPAPGVERRVRCYRDPAGTQMWVETTKERVSEATRVEVEAHVDAVTAAELLLDADPAASPVRKVRRTFVHDYQVFCLDEVLAPVQAWVCEVELLAADTPFELPEWLGPVREVTDDPDWSMASLARRAPTHR